MGEYAELALADEFEYYINCPKQPSKQAKPIWKTKDGRKMYVEDMQTSHIQFSIAKCRRDNWRMEAIPYFEEELRKRRM